MRQNLFRKNFGEVNKLRERPHCHAVLAMRIMRFNQRKQLSISVRD
jgi:hypothetical protein